MEKTMTMPQKYVDMVGTRRVFSGGIFSSKRSEPELEYDILDWRWGSSKIIDMRKMTPIHPTIEFKIKREGMQRARWTKPFPVREIELQGWK